jgi:hypothetical protein
VAYGGVKFAVRQTAVFVFVTRPAD